MQPLNSPLELGLRTLVVLTAAFPRTFDLDRLVLLDYCLLHSADLEGPPSVLPAVPNRSGELGLKRTVLDHGVQLMARAGMVDLVTTAEGMTYRAGEAAAPFLRLLDSPLLGALEEVATWAVDEFGDLNTDQVRDRLRAVSEGWATEFAWEPTDEEEMFG